MYANRITVRALSSRGPFGESGDRHRSSKASSIWRSISTATMAVRMMTKSKAHRDGLMARANILGVLDMPAAKQEVRNARRWLRRMTNGHDEIVDDVVLLGCELATNAIRHSDSSELSIVVLATNEAIRVEVIDAGSDTNEPRMIDPDVDAVRGRGLRMVNELTNGRWGTYEDGNGRVVWFEKLYRPY
jgi:anti-sigma regulatory factor (Ser/Thr protein kinase)